MRSRSTSSQPDSDGSEGIGGGTALPPAIQLRPINPKTSSGVTLIRANPLLTRAPDMTLRMLTPARKPMNSVVVAIPPRRVPAQGQKPAR